MSVFLSLSVGFVHVTCPLEYTMFAPLILYCGHTRGYIDPPLSGFKLLDVEFLTVIDRFVA